MDASTETMAYEEGQEASGANPFAVVLRTLRGRLPLATLIALACGAAASTAGFTLVKQKFASHGVIRVAPTTQRVLYESEENTLLPLFDSYVAAQETYLKSRPVLERALRDEALIASGFPTGEEGIRAFLEKVKVHREKRTELISVSAVSGDATTAQAIVNAVLSGYEDLYGETAARTTSVKEEVLGARRDELRAALDENNGKMIEVGGEYDPYSLPKVHLDRIRALAELDDRISDLDDAILSQEANDAAAANAGGLDPGDGEILRLTVLDHAMADMLNQRAVISARVASVSERYRDEHPRVQELLREREAMDEAIESRRNQLAQLGKNGLLVEPGFENNEDSADQLRAVRDRLRTARSSLRDEAVLLHKKSLELDLLARDRAKLLDLLDDVGHELERMRIEGKAALPGRIEIAIRANRPVKPASDKRKIAAAIGAGGGGIFGLVLVIIFGLLARPLRYSDDLPSAVRDEVLVTLPKVSGDPNEDLTWRRGVQRTAHVLDAIETGPTGPDPRVIVVTGSRGSTGRTSLVDGLAREFADSARRIILIDADFGTAGLSDRWSVADRPGLQEALATGDAAGLVSETSVGVGILPVGMPEGSGSGERPRTPFAARRLLDSLKTGADLILVDAGAASGASASIFLPLADDVLFVVDADLDRGAVIEDYQRLAPFLRGRVHALFNRSRKKDPGLSSVAA